jgi:hypothetical protein
VKFRYLLRSKKRNEYEKKLHGHRVQEFKSQTETGASQERTGKQSHCGFPKSRKEKRRNRLTFPAVCGRVLVMNNTMNTNEETVSAAEFYGEIYSGFTELTAQDVADYKAEIDREKNEEIV